jgi:hypothetical protein
MLRSQSSPDRVRNDGTDLVGNPFPYMLSASRWADAILNAALGCLVIVIAIAVTIRAIAKRLKPNPARIEIKAAQLPPATPRIR